MADTPNTSNNTAQSPQQTKELLEMIAAFKEKNKLEGDYRDLLKDSIKESQKAIKDQLKSAATIQNINRSTINIEQAQKLINDTKLKQYYTEVKLGNLQKSLSENNGAGLELAKQYNKVIEDRQNLEEKVIDFATKHASIIAKADIEEREAIKAQSKAENDLAKDEEYFNQTAKEKLKLEQAISKLLIEKPKLTSKSTKEEREINKQYEAQLDATKKILKQKTIESQIAESSKNTSQNNLNLANALLQEKYSEYLISKNNLNISQEDLLVTEQKLQLMNQSLTPQQAAYAQALKTLELIKLQRAEQDALLELERKKSKQIGVSGNLFKIFSEKLGFGTQVYEAMTEKATELVEKNGKVGMFFGKLQVIAAGIRALTKSVLQNITDPAVVATGLYTAASKTISTSASFVNKMTGTGGPIAGLTSHISSLVSNIPLIGGLLATAIDGFSNLLDFAVGATSKIQEMGREIGLSKVQAIALNNQFSNFSISTGKAYINSEKLFKTQIELTKVLGVNNQISKDNLVTYFELNKFLGVDAQTSAEIEKTSRLTGRSAKDIAMSVMGQVKGLQKATGISLNFQQVLKEASSLSGYLGLQFAKYPEKLTKSLLTTKALGLELKTLDSMADSFLDFETSIGKEFEAQLLTGKEVNLSKARELFLNNKLADAAVEISKQVGTSTEFMNQNRIAAEAWAGTFGMSRDQMADFLKQQEINAKFGATSTQDLQKKVALMRSQGREQEAINKLGSEEAFNKLVTASATEDLSGFIDKIKQSFADLVANTNLADLVQNAIKFLSSPDNIIKIVTKIKDVFGTIVSVMGSLIGGLMRFVNVFSRFTGFKISESMIGMAEGAGAQIKALDVGNLVGYKKKDEVEQAEAEKEKKLAVKEKQTKIQTTQAEKLKNKVSSIPTLPTNTIEPENLTAKTSPIDQYKSQQVESISDIKSKKESEQYNFAEGFKSITSGLENAMAKLSSPKVNINVENNATYRATGGEVATLISTSGGYESSRMFAATG
jgi:hypothetical protein